MRGKSASSRLLKHSLRKLIAIDWYSIVKDILQVQLKDNLSFWPRYSNTAVKTTASWMRGKSASSRLLKHSLRNLIDIDWYSIVKIHSPAELTQNPCRKPHPARLDQNRLRSEPRLVLIEPIRSPAVYTQLLHPSYPTYHYKLPPTVPHEESPLSQHRGCLHSPASDHHRLQREESDSSSLMSPDIGIRYHSYSGSGVTLYWYQVLFIFWIRCHSILVSGIIHILDQVSLDIGIRYHSYSGSGVTLYWYQVLFIFWIRCHSILVSGIIHILDQVSHLVPVIKQFQFKLRFLTINIFTIVGGKHCDNVSLNGLSI
ncbi:uncharacterized protein LOC131706940 [Acipenser ruthenus]|uniref:uncharacterized protein LOC131706940 n=1 Tax=Acipenser ruthenus TaxID=7906 RepID=UPI0027426E01|nr:uncharacterized protein LOC131706940 [Acipenser ruthenus]